MIELRIWLGHDNKIRRVGYASKFSRPNEAIRMRIVSAEWRKTAKSGCRARIARLLDRPGNLPGTWMRHPISREVGCGSQVPGQFPSSRDILREVGCGSLLPGEFHGNSAAPDCGSSPWKLVAIKSGNPARRRRSGGPHHQEQNRLNAIPAFPRLGAGVSGPRERLGHPVPEFRGLRPSLCRN